MRGKFIQPLALVDFMDLPFTTEKTQQELLQELIHEQGLKLSPKRFIHKDDSFPYDRIFLRSFIHEEIDSDGVIHRFVMDDYFYFEKTKNYLFDKKRKVNWTKEKIIQHSLQKLHSDSFTQKQKDIQDKEYFDKYFETHSFD